MILCLVRCNNPGCPFKSVNAAVLGTETFLCYQDSGISACIENSDLQNGLQWQIRKGRKPRVNNRPIPSTAFSTVKMKYPLFKTIVPLVYFSLWEVLLFDHVIMHA